MKRLNVAIIGQGRSGRNIHGAHLVTDPERYRIALCVDPLEDRRRRAEQEYKCDVAADYRDALKRRDIDLVVNATPSHMHVPVSLDFLNAGFNLLCEKPLAGTVEEVDRLIDAAEKSGAVFTIYQQARYAPFFEQMQKVIRSGVLGRVVQLNFNYNGFARRWDWQTLQEFNGGSLMNTGPHPLDQALALFGDGTPKVFCRMDRCLTLGDAEDHVKVVLYAQGHPTIDIEISACCPYPAVSYNLYATQGGMKGTQQELEWTYYVPSEAPPVALVRTPLCKPDGTPTYCGERLPMRTENWKVPEHVKSIFQAGAVGLYGMLHRVITEGAQLEITPEQVRRQIAVIEECRRQNPHIYATAKN